MAIKTRDFDGSVRNSADVLAYVHKGKKVDGIPQDTDEFFFKTSDEYGWLDKHLTDFFGDETKTLYDIHVLTDDPADDISYEAWFEQYARTKDGKQPLMRRCNGEQIVGERVNWVWSDNCRACECNGDPGEDSDCKVYGRLRFRVPEFDKWLYEERGQFVPDGYFELRHGSDMDHENIMSALTAIDQRWARPYGRQLSTVPLMLYRKPVYIRRFKRTFHVLNLSPMPGYRNEMIQRPRFVGGADVVGVKEIRHDDDYEAPVESQLSPENDDTDDSSAPQVDDVEPTPKTAKNKPEDDSLKAWLDKHMRRHVGRTLTDTLSALHEVKKDVPIDWAIPTDKDTAARQLLDWFCETKARFCMFGIVNDENTDYYETYFCHLPIRIYGAGSKLETAGYTKELADTVRLPGTHKMEFLLGENDDHYPLARPQRNEKESGDVYYTVEKIDAPEIYLADNFNASESEDPGGE